MNRGSARPKLDLVGPKPKTSPAPATERPMPRLIAEFQTDAVELEEKAPPRVARVTLYALVALILSAVGWASVSEIDEVVIAQGKLITTQPTIIVQPLETSIIRSIHVANGDVVRAGQTLVTFDATFSQSDVEQLRSKYAALDAQVKRVEAELSETDYSPSPERTPTELLQMQLNAQRSGRLSFRISTSRSPASMRRLKQRGTNSPSSKNVEIIFSNSSTSARPFTSNEMARSVNSSAPAANAST